MNEQLDTLRKLWREKIPLTVAMQAELSICDGACQVSAPLEPNSNHMNTGFGGSLATLATLAGWAQTSIVMNAPENYHIVIAHSDVRFTATAHHDLYAIATIPNDANIAAFNATLARKSRSAIKMHVNVFSGGQEVAVFTGKFVAVEKNNSST